MALQPVLSTPYQLIEFTGAFYLRGTSAPVSIQTDKDLTLARSAKGVYTLTFTKGVAFPDSAFFGCDVVVAPNTGIGSAVTNRWQAHGKYASGVLTLYLSSGTAGAANAASDFNDAVAPKTGTIISYAARFKIRSNI